MCGFALKMCGFALKMCGFSLAKTALFQVPLKQRCQSSAGFGNALCYTNAGRRLKMNKGKDIIRPGVNKLSSNGSESSNHARLDEDMRKRKEAEKQGIIAKQEDRSCSHDN